MFRPRSLFTVPKKTIAALLFGLAFSATLAYAIPPLTQYDPAETLDPICAPGDTNCSVDISGTGAMWGSITGTLSDQTDLQNALNAKESLLTFSTGLTRSTNTITSNLSTGVSGGQTAIGGTASGNNLTLSSTSNGTKGKILFGTSGAYDEANGRLGIGTTAPETILHLDVPTVQIVKQTIVTIEGAFGTPILDINYSGNGTVALGRNAGMGLGNPSNTSSATFVGAAAGYDLSNSTPLEGIVAIGTSAFEGGQDIVASVALGQEAGSRAQNVSNSNFIGRNAGTDVFNSQYSNYIGTGAFASGNHIHSNFIGRGAGTGQANNITNSTFIGLNAGYRANSLTDSILIGTYAGAEMTSDNVVYLGKYAGYQMNGDNSIFIGENAGRNPSVDNWGSGGANNSIFIGTNAGYTDDDGPLDNSGGGTSILIGDDTSTGGFSNSIALGKNATNTASNQLTIGPAYTQLNVRGVNYTWPSAQAGGSGYVLSNNGSGVLSWVAGGGGGGSITLQTDGVDNGSQSILNLVGGSNVTLTDDGSGTVTIDASGGGGGGSGTVTSVAMTVPTGLSVSGSPITSSGTLAVSTSLNGLVYGTGTGFAVATIGTGLDFTGGVISATGGTGTVTSVDISGAGPLSFTGGPITSSGTLALSFGGSATDVLLADGSAVPYETIYSADGSISGTRTVSYTGSIVFLDTSNTKSGFSLDSNANISRLGAGNGFPTFEVDTNMGRFSFIDGGLYIPGGAVNNHVLTSDASGNASWQVSQAGGIGQSSFFSAALSAGSGATNASNSIFLGTNAGLNDTVNNTGSADDYSILLGQNTSTGGFENSIAIGSGATNSASNEFMIGSSTRRIETLVFNSGSGNTCSIVAGSGISCSSDERLKTNIEDLETDTLEKVLNLRTVRYNWNSSPEGDKMIGFIAQDLESPFPELIMENNDGMLAVNYAQMAPILVEAIREMNLKITSINDIDTDNSWRDSLVEWFASATNGIGRLFAGEIITNTLCVADENGEKTCLTKGQLDTILGNTSPNNDGPDESPIDEPQEAEESNSEEIVPTPIPEESDISEETGQVPLDEELQTPPEISVEPEEAPSPEVEL